MKEWISIKDKIPPCRVDREQPYVLAYHTIYGVGVAWFWVFDDDTKNELEEDFNSKYLCSCEFIKTIPDGNYFPETDHDVDIFENLICFSNLGTVTHWMELPSPPKGDDVSN